MLLWSYPGIVGDIQTRTTFAATLDLGCRWYHPTAIRVAGIMPRTTDTLRQALPEGTRVVVIAQHITGDQPVRAHVLLDDGTDLVTKLTGRRAQPIPEAAYGSGLDKVWRYPATVTTNRDGDTFTCSLDMGVPTRYITGVRVAGIDCPETGTLAGKDAATYARMAAPPGTPVTVVSRQLEKWGRVLGDLTLPDGRDYAADLIALGHARPYQGGTR